MRWTPPVTDGLQAYDTFVFAWAASHERLYTTRTGAPAGTISSTPPATLAAALAFDIPQSADMYGVQLIGVRDGTVGTSTIAWTVLKAEAFALGDSDATTDVTFALDSGRQEEPNLWYPSGVSPAGLSTQVIARGFLDVSSGDANVNASEWLREGAETATAIARRTIWFSPFGATVGLPYVGHYRRVYLVLSADPGVANVTARYTLKIRPIAVRSGEDADGYK